MLFSGCMPIQYVGDTAKDALRGPKDRYMISRIKISPDGRYLVAKRKDEWNFVIYDLETKSILREKKNFDWGFLTFSNNSKQYFYYDKNDKKIVFRDIFTDEITRVLTTPYPVKTVKFFPDNKRAILSFDTSKMLHKNSNSKVPHVLCFYDGDTFVPLRDDNVKKSNLLDRVGVAIAKDSSYFYTFSDAGKSNATLKLYGIQEFQKYGLVKWRTDDLKVIYNYRNPKIGSFGGGGILLSPDEKNIWVCGSYRALFETNSLNVIMHNIKDSTFIKPWLMGKGMIFEFLNNGNLFCVVGYGNIEINQVTSDYSIVKKYPYDKNKFCQNAFDINMKENLICGGMQSGEIMVWKYYPETNEIKEYWKAPTGRMNFKTYKESKAYDRRKSASMTVWAINK